VAKLSVIGLGKLGACSAACFASKGFDVIGVDINKDSVDAINKGRAPVYEPRLQELITASKGKLKAAQDYGEAIRKSDITFLIVPTPSRHDGHFSDMYLQDALRHLSKALKQVNKQYHLFVVTSTVSPGTTEGNLIPLIESVSGKKLNTSFGVCYNPEFIALGSVINDFLNPDMVLIGESDKQAGDRLAEVYRTVCENEPCIARMSVISAEIAKISLNSYITMKISFANTLANICEHIPGADLDAITSALGADRRVSPYYIKGGPSYGGPCFPRDNKAFIAFAKTCNRNAALAEATDVVNQVQGRHIIDLVLENLSSSSNNVVGFLGLSYKPGTPVIEESPALKIIEELRTKTDVEIIVYDPLAMDNARTYFGDNILYASSVSDCLRHATICVITTQADEFRTLSESCIPNGLTTIIDCWRMLDPAKLGPKVKYMAVGKHVE